MDPREGPPSWYDLVNATPEDPRPRTMAQTAPSSADHRMETAVEIAESSKNASKQAPCRQPKSSSRSDVRLSTMCLEDYDVAFTALTTDNAIEVQKLSPSVLREVRARKLGSTFVGCECSKILIWA